MIRQSAARFGRNPDDIKMAQGLCVDSRDLSSLDDSQFDHVLCMGPMYHLAEEQDRIQTINECLRVLKPGGTLFVAFVSSYSFVWDYLV